MTRHTGSSIPKVEPGLGASALPSLPCVTVMKLHEVAGAVERFLLHMRLPDPSALVRAATRDEGPPAVRVVAAGPGLGAPVLLVAAMEQGPLPLWSAQGRVLRRRPVRGQEFELDVVVSEDDRPARQQLVALLNGKAPEKRERVLDRHAVHLKTVVTAPGLASPVKAVIRDLGHEGAGLDCTSPPPVGTTVELAVKTGWFAKPVNLRALVCWSDPARGFGARFLFTCPTERAFVDGHLANVQRRG